MAWTTPIDLRPGDKFKTAPAVDATWVVSGYEGFVVIAHEETTDEVQTFGPSEIVFIKEKADE